MKKIFILLLSITITGVIYGQSGTAIFESDYIKVVNSLPESMGQCSDVEEFVHDILIKKGLESFSGEITLPKYSGIDLVSFQILKTNVSDASEDNLTSTSNLSLTTIDGINKVSVDIGSTSFVVGDKLLVKYSLQAKCIGTIDTETGGQNTVAFSYIDSETSSTLSESVYKTLSYSVLQPNLFVTAKDIDNTFKNQNLSPITTELLGELKQEFKIENAINGQPIKRLRIQVEYSSGDNGSNADILSYVSSSKFKLVGPAQDKEIIPLIVNQSTYEFVINASDLNYLGFTNGELKAEDLFVIEVYNQLKKDFSTTGSPIENNRVNVKLSVDISCDELVQCSVNNNTIVQEIQFNYNKSLQSINVTFSTSKGELCKGLLDNSAYVDVTIENNSNQLASYQPYFLLDRVVIGQINPLTFGLHSVTLLEEGQAPLELYSGKNRTFYLNGPSSVIDENTSQTTLINPNGDGYNALPAGKTLKLRYYFALDCNPEYGAKNTSVYFRVYDLESYFSKNPWSSYKSSTSIYPIYLTSSRGTSSISVAPSMWTGKENQASTSNSSITYAPNGDVPVIGGSLFVGCDATSHLEAEIDVPNTLDYITVSHQGNSVPIISEAIDLEAPYFEVVDVDGVRTVTIYNGDLTAYQIDGKYNCTNQGLTNATVTGRLYFVCGNSNCNSPCRFRVRNNKSTDVFLNCESEGGSSCGVNAPDFDVYRTTPGKQINPIQFYSESQLVASPDYISNQNRNKIIQGDKYKIVSNGAFSSSSCSADINKLIFSFSASYDIGGLIDGSSLIADGIDIGENYTLVKNGGNYSVEITINELNKLALSQAGSWTLELMLKSSNSSPSNNDAPQKFTNVNFVPYYNSDKVSSFELTNLDPEKVLYILRDDISVFEDYHNDDNDSDCTTELNIFYYAHNNKKATVFSGDEVRPVLRVKSFKFILPQSMSSIVPQLTCQFVARHRLNNATHITPIQLSAPQTNGNGDIELTVTNVNEIPILNYAAYRGNNDKRYFGNFNLKLPYNCVLKNELIRYESRVEFTDDVIEPNSYRESTSLYKHPQNAYDLNYGDLSSSPSVGTTNQQWDFKLKKLKDFPISWVLIENDVNNQGDINFPSLITDNLGHAFTLSPIVPGEKYIAIITGMSTGEQRTFNFTTTFDNCNVSDNFYIKTGWACEPTLESVIANYECNQDDALFYTALYLQPGIQGLNVKNINSDGIEIDKSAINICDDFYYSIETVKLQSGYLNGANLEISRSSGLEVVSVYVEYIDETDQVVDSKTFSNNIGEVLSLNSLSGIADLNGWDDKYKLRIKIQFRGSCNYDFSQPITFAVTSDGYCDEVSSGKYIENSIIDGIDLDKLKIEVTPSDLSILSFPSSERKVSVNYKRSNVTAPDGWQKVNSSQVVLAVPLGMEVKNDAISFTKGGVTNAIPQKQNVIYQGINYTIYTWEEITWDNEEVNFEYTLKDQTLFANGIQDIDIYMGINIQVDLNCSSGSTCNSWLELQKDKFSLEPTKTPPPNCDECISSFSPLRGKEYVVSCWVSASNPEGKTDFTGIELELTYEGANDVQTFTPTGQIIDGWQRIEGILTIPPTATKLYVKVKNNGREGFYLDDIRMSPKNSSFVTYVYDPLTLRLVAELDEHNYATIYEYDEEGALVRVKKETERGIQTIQESRNNMRRK